MTDPTFNVASHVARRAAERPFQRALVQPEGYNHLGKRCYSHLTYTQLDALVDAYAHGLTAQGFARGDRVMMFVRQGFELIALTFALFKMGAVPVMIDPGMGRKSLLACVAHTKPTGFIGIPLAHAIRKVFRGPFKSVTHKVSTRPAWWAGAASLPDIARFDAGPFEAAETTRSDLAAILFTSGSTGIPKGVHYTHGIFDGQVQAIGRMYGIEPGEIEVPAFPLFSLFSVALGMTVIIPDMDPTKPAEIDPKNIVEAIVDHGATSAFGSPAVWERVGTYCQERGIMFPTLRRILTAGAPINPVLLAKCEAMLRPEAHLHTPYGATECLPVATISSQEILEEAMPLTRKGMGLCVGEPVEDMQVRIVGITDDPIATFADADVLPAGEIGEICVSGTVTTRIYDGMPEQTARAKIPDPERGEDAFWHRMGDVGYLDDRGRLWYCGRKAHRVETSEGVVFSIACEGIFNTHDDVFRSALVGIGERGSQRPVIIIEAAEGKHPGSASARKDFAEALLQLAGSHDRTRAIQDVLFHEGFPVDRRHNAKIHREELAVWAAGQL